MRDDASGVQWREVCVYLCMRYAESVPRSAQLDCCGTLRHAWAGLACALLLLFAVGAKVAWYQPHEAGHRAIAATKICSNKAEAEGRADGPVSPQPAAGLDSLTVFRVPLAVPSVRRAASEAEADAARNWNHLQAGPRAQRPPPVLDRA